MFPTQSRRGFTLIELLLVIGIVAILAAIVIVAIGPTRELGDARNAQRSSDVNKILNAVYSYAIDNKGAVPAAITTTETEICNTGAPDCKGLVDLDTLTGAYIDRMPGDPTAAAANGTGYDIKKDADGRVITVNAPAAENGEVVSVSR